jgi:hypothetical protein
MTLIAFVCSCQEASTFHWDPSVPPRFAWGAPFDPSRAPIALHDNDEVGATAVATAMTAAAASDAAESTWGAAVLPRLWHAYVARFGDKPCCVADLQRYLHWSVCNLHWL